jgi:hypothetical protein
VNVGTIIFRGGGEPLSFCETVSAFGGGEVLAVTGANSPSGPQANNTRERIRIQGVLYILFSHKRFVPIFYFNFDNSLVIPNEFS